MTNYVEDGWTSAYDHREGKSVWISPNGRIADQPGGPFQGQVSRATHIRLKKQSRDIERRW